MLTMRIGRARLHVARANDRKSESWLAEVGVRDQPEKRAQRDSLIIAKRCRKARLCLSPAGARNSGLFAPARSEVDELGASVARIPPNANETVTLQWFQRMTECRAIHHQRLRK
nr:hypothetical protein [Bradyrhizobium prioritasuperba]